MKGLILVCTTLVSLSSAPALSAADSAATTTVTSKESTEAKHAMTLLARAVDYYKEYKDRALATFSRVGKFT